MCVCISIYVCGGHRMMSSIFTCHKCHGKWIAVRGQPQLSGFCPEAGSLSFYCCLQGPQVLGFPSLCFQLLHLRTWALNFLPLPPGLPDMMDSSYPSGTVSQKSMFSTPSCFGSWCFITAIETLTRTEPELSAISKIAIITKGTQISLLLWLV